MSVNVRELQRQRNAESRENWDCFTSHRDKVTNLLSPAAPHPSARLCVLGAGNCNDLDLSQLLKSFARIELVDLDADAMRDGIERQGVPTDQLVRHEGLDITGIAERISAWSPDDVRANDDVESCITEAKRTVIDLRGEFQVTASVCLLSQLIQALTLTLGEDHPRFLELLMAVRQRHLRLMLDLTSPGGTLILISDVVSSFTCPQLLAASDQQLPQVVIQAIASRNFFHGVNPFVLKSLFQTDPDLAPLAKNVELGNPWLWDLGPRIYAVCAVRAQRA